MFSCTRFSLNLTISKLAFYQYFNHKITLWILWVFYQYRLWSNMGPALGYRQLVRKTPAACSSLKSSDLAMSWNNLQKHIWAMTWQNSTKWLCTQQRLRSAWTFAKSAQSSLCAQWVAKDPRFLHADSEDSDQTARMPRLIWVFTGRTLILLVLSCRGSYLPVHFTDAHKSLYEDFLSTYIHKFSNKCNT